jgi:L-amino acid N-acyltransferase YncA
MVCDKKIRLATQSDSKVLLEIYAPFIKDTLITFEYEVPTVAEFGSRISNIEKRYPWLVCEIDGQIVGYAYASQFNERTAYDWTVDVSVYVHPDYQRKKIAVALYSCLFELLKLQGFYSICAIITASNKRSLNFHQAFGFKTAGHYQNIGYKFDQWLDVEWLSLVIGNFNKPPQKPKSIQDIKGTPEFDLALSKALEWIEKF